MEGEEGTSAVKIEGKSTNVATLPNMMAMKHIIHGLYIGGFQPLLTGGVAATAYYKALGEEDNWLKERFSQDLDFIILHDNFTEIVYLEESGKFEAGSDLRKAKERMVEVIWGELNADYVVEVFQDKEPFGMDNLFYIKLKKGEVATKIGKIVLPLWEIATGEGKPGIQISVNLTSEKEMGEMVINVAPPGMGRDKVEKKSLDIYVLAGKNGDVPISHSYYNEVKEGEEISIIEKKLVRYNFNPSVKDDAILLGAWKEERIEEVQKNIIEHMIIEYELESSYLQLPFNVAALEHILVSKFLKSRDKDGKDFEKLVKTLEEKGIGINVEFAMDLAHFYKEGTAMRGEPIDDEKIKMLESRIKHLGSKEDYRKKLYENNGVVRINKEMWIGVLKALKKDPQNIK